MARVGEHFADGWQKTEKAGGKDYSDAIRSQGDASREVANRDAARPQAAEDRPQVQTERPAPQQAARTEQAARPQVNQEVAGKQAAKDAAKEYIQAKGHANALGQLTGSAAAQRGAEVATRQPVVNVTQAQDAFVQNQPAPRQAQVSQQAAGPQAQAAKTADASRPANTARPSHAAAKDRGPNEQAKAKVQVEGQDLAQLANSALVKADGAIPAPARTDDAAKIDGPKDWESDDGIEDEGGSNDRNASTFAVGSRPRSTKRDLGALLGGSAGQGNDNAESEPSKYAIDLTKARASDAVEIPESDPAFAVYSEFDSDKVGPETYRAKYQVLAKYVLKKLGEIARLDQRLDAEIRSAFENTPLSKRIIGDIDIEVSKFTGSVYGEGAIRG